MQCVCYKICIKFGEKVTEYDKVFLNGTLISWSDQVKHLGNVVNNKLSDEQDCFAKRCAFNGSVNKLIGVYAGLQRDILCKLFKSYCCSFYGSELWNISSSGFKSCCVQWNKAVRKIFNLPYRTHTWLLGPLMEQDHISVNLYIKSLRFMYKMCNSTNNTVSFLGHIARNCATLPLGGNMSYLRFKYNVNFEDVLSKNIARVIDAHYLTTYQKGIVNFVWEILNVKESIYDIPKFNDSLIDDILNSICIN